MAAIGKAASQQAKEFGSTKSLPVVFWAWVGGALCVLELYIWVSWITGPYFVPTDPGPDPISDQAMLQLYFIQGLGAVLGVFCLWHWILRPWMKYGKPTTDAMLAFCCCSLVVFDCSMNYTVPSVLYNSHAFNRGSWTLGSYPGWTSPNGNLLPEPLLVIISGYLCMEFGMVLFVCWLMRSAKSRYPNLGIASCIGLIILAMTIVDSVLEILILRTGVYAYPAGIREVTLFAGETYQFPLTEGLFFGGLAIGAVTVLRFFTNDRGQTFVERGIDRLKVGETARTWIKFLALFGYTHLAFILLFTIPNQWLATHGDPYPKGYPSYMINNMCVGGDTHDQCPGPGVSIPRR